MNLRIISLTVSLILIISSYNSGRESSLINSKNGGIYLDKKTEIKPVMNKQGKSTLSSVFFDYQLIIKP